MEDTLAPRLDLVRATVRTSPAVVAAFGEYLRTAPEEQLFRMNPFVLSERLKVPERTGADLCLAATHVGLLEFSWGLICHACGGFLNTPSALRALHGQRCAMCEVDAEVNDDSVEVAFTVSPSVRKIRFHTPAALDLRRDWKPLYFSPSRVLQPALSEALETIFVSTHQLVPGANLIEANLPVGRYAISAPAEHSWLNLDIEEGGPSSISVDLVHARFLPARITAGPGPLQIQIHNRDGSRMSAALVTNLVPRLHERENSPTPEVVLKKFLTAKELVTSQLFRELFRAESLPSDAGLEFKSLTLLFTDLKGSTELYERVGDFRAYALVREHFALLHDIVAARGGAMVKTIGDAVMASFPDPVSALWAAAQMNREIKSVGAGDLELKIGLHEGSCIAVESNERLDYFGRTVNIAARAQGAADANQIVCTESVFSAPGSAAVLQRMELAATRDKAIFKGVDGEVTVYRLH